MDWRYSVNLDSTGGTMENKVKEEIMWIMRFAKSIADDRGSYENEAFQEIAERLGKLLDIDVAPLDIK